MRRALRTFRRLPATSSLTLQRLSMSTSSATMQRFRRQIPVPVHRGMTELDRDKFSVNLKCLAARLDSKEAGKLLANRAVRSQLLDVAKTKALEEDPEHPGEKLMLFDVESQEALSTGVQDLLEGKVKAFAERQVTVSYDHWSASEIIDAILPEDLVDRSPTAFTTTGHIGHLNLKEEYLAYKYLIGQVILDKNKNLRTIVNKLDTIDTEFRVFRMEILAGYDGPDAFLTTASEAGCRFSFDFSKVYWNSRLSTEHNRIVDRYFEPGQVVADVMAGVGPFAVPAAKKRCFVMGNDLNPDSAHWMEVNRKDNKVEHALRVTNLEGRAFIRQAPLAIWREPFAPLPPPPIEQRRLDKERRRLREAAVAAGQDPAEALAALKLSEKTESTPRFISHFVMNLPASAIEFLDAYRGCYNALRDEVGFPGVEQVPMPLVHTHCFSKEAEGEPAERDICQRASQYLGHPVSPSIDGYNLHYVRKVAPNKDMYCITFRLPREVAFAKGA